MTLPGGSPPTLTVSGPAYKSWSTSSFSQQAKFDKDLWYKCVGAMRLEKSVGQADLECMWSRLILIQSEAAVCSAKFIWPTKVKPYVSHDLKQFTKIRQRKANVV